MGNLKDVFQLLRLKQWTKNILVIVPAFFAGIITIQKVSILAQGFIAFCITSSIVYILNDWRDKELDALHPTKKNRPIPRGVFSTTQLITLIGILLLGIGVLSTQLPSSFNLTLGLFFTLNFLYSFGLKKIPYLEMGIVAFGFLLRIFAGGFLVDVPISKWLILLISMTALLIVCAKRNAEIQNGNLKARVVLKYYHSNFIKGFVIFLAFLSVVAYFMYCLDQEVIKRIGSNKLFYTTIFILLGMGRYLQQVFFKLNTGAPSELFYKDKIIFVIILSWLTSFYYLLYAH